MWTLNVDFFGGRGGYMYMYTVYMKFWLHVHIHCVHEIFNLHHSGTQFFLGTVDIFLDTKNRQLHSLGG